MNPFWTRRQLSRSWNKLVRLWRAFDRKYGMALFTIVVLATFLFTAFLAYQVMLLIQDWFTSLMNLELRPGPVKNLTLTSGANKRAGEQEEGNGNGQGRSEETENSFMQKFVKAVTVLTDSDLHRRLTLSEDIWKGAVAKRGKYLESVYNNDLSAVPMWEGDASSTVLWNYFYPSFTCPYSLQRVGSIGGGRGKWVCGLELFEPQGSNEPCTIYSIGVGNDSSFEAEILERTENCEIFAYDSSANGMGPQVAVPNPRVTFKKYGVGRKPTLKYQSKSLKDIMTENDHDWIDILKIDIRGEEFRLMEQLMLQFDPLPFGQCVMKLHPHLRGKTFAEFYTFWRKLEEAGLRPFQSELNYASLSQSQAHEEGEGGRVMEYSFLNIKGDHKHVKVKKEEVRVKDLFKLINYNFI